jgi:uncharacterized protein (UPF0332 family)
MQRDYFLKAQENLASANALFELTFYNAAANRAYYAAFHSAVSVLARYGVTHDENPHEWVQARFAAELIHRRKVFSIADSATLLEIQRLRHIADYKATSVGKTAVARQIRKATDFCNHVQQKLQL